VPDKSWKAFERRLCRDVGTERIPVTGERDGADGATEVFCFQFKLRRKLPSWLWVWLGGIVAAGQRAGKVGVLVVKQPRQRDNEAIVMLRWQDWVDLHGRIQKERTHGKEARKAEGPEVVPTTVS
jgi:hypothetical protein